MFTLLGFMGMYTVLGILFLFLVRREIDTGRLREPAHAVTRGIYGNAMVHDRRGHGRRLRGA